MDRAAVIPSAVLALAVAGAVLAGLLGSRARSRDRGDLDRWSHWLDEATAGRLPIPTHDDTVEASLGARLRRLLLAARDAERRLDEEKGAIQSLIGSIAHQTKTPLTNILLHGELVAEGELSAAQRAQVDLILDQAAKLDMLMTALVKAAYLESGAIRVAPVPCRLDPVVAAAVREVDATARGRGTDLIAPATGVRCRADATWLREVLVNLLDNALKYSPPGSAVTVDVAQLEVFCRIDVTDVGAGIPEEETASVFRRFYRSPRTADVPGLGIGLSLTRQVVTLHGGFVRVRSAVDRGSTFSVYLPRADPFDRVVER